MSVRKKPLTEVDYMQLQRAATVHKNPDALRAVQLLRYTGMHISVIADPIKHNLSFRDGYITWLRPKKKGNDALVVIKKSKHITFDLTTWIVDLRGRRLALDGIEKSRGIHLRASRQYFYKLIQECGAMAGLKNISPMSLRHTFAVQSLPILGRDMVQQIMNCSSKTLQTYVKYDTKTQREVYDRVGW